MTDKNNKGCLGTPVVVLKAASGMGGVGLAIMLLVMALVMWLTLT